jgi:Na+-driven multidrug efflux pump
MNSLTTSRDPNAGTVLSLAWPMTLKAVFLHGTVVIDGNLVSSLGETSLAAMGLAAATAGFVLGTIFAFSNALQIRTAQAYGTGNKVFLKSVLASGLTASVAICFVGLVLVALVGSLLIDSLAPSEQIAELAWSYLSIFTLVIVGESIGQCLSSFFNGCGQTRIPLYSFCLSVPINIAASIVLIHGLLGFPQFGVAGAAMGSAIAIGIQVAFLLVVLVLKHGSLRKIVGWYKATFLATLGNHVKFSLPIATTFISAIIATHVCSLIYSRLSLNEFAAMTLIAPWIMVAGTIGMQWAQATGILVAQLLGKASSEDLLDRFLSRAWRGAFIAAGFVAAIYGVLSVSSARIYPDLSAETHAALLSFLPILLLLPFPKGSNAICGNTLRASGDTIYVMHIFVWSQWLFRVPATALLILYFDVAAVWVLSLLLIEELIKFPAFHRRLFRGQWKRATIGA